VNSIPVKSRALPGRGQPADKKENSSSRPPSVIDEPDGRPMDGQYPPHRGNYGTHRGQQRPYLEARHQGYGGSPPYSSNSSYHGSPQANSPYHNQRGGWGGHGSVCPSKPVVLLLIKIPDRYTIPLPLIGRIVTLGQAA
jgi:hypothetical protein